MLTSAKNGKQNGDTLTRRPEPGYLNLSNNKTSADIGMQLPEKYSSPCIHINRNFVIILTQ
jgi:hypothetical protein